VFSASASFPEQASLYGFISVIFFAVGTTSLFLAVIAMGLIDSGLVRRKSSIDTWVQKLLCALLAGFAMLVGGYALWQWQFNSALGVPNPFRQAMSDWWIGGGNFRHFATELNPAAVPEADTLQSYGAFFLTWAALVGALLHSVGIERAKALPMFILSIVAGGVVMPVIAYLTWGSAGPLSNQGVHDYVGIFAMYLLVGSWALVLAWRLGPRLGSRGAHPRTSGPAPQSLATSAAGAGLLMVALPLPILSCGYFVPDLGYFGISLTSSGMGLVLTNLFVAYAAGAIAGGVIAYRTRNPIMAIFGPVAGYVSCAAGLDVFTPVETFLVALGGPVVTYIGVRVMMRLGIDDTKIVPLTLFAGTYGAIVPGFVAWHTKTGGYFGGIGDYAFQHAEITPWWQITGWAATVGIALASGLVVVLLLEKTIGLRISEEEEIAGLDVTYWDAPPSVDDVDPLGTAAVPAPGHRSALVD
jgi:Amt family ammonium transporter